MLEWKPKLVLLVVGLISIAASMGFSLSPANFNWGSLF
jgi:hypothetical protein